MPENGTLNRITPLFFDMTSALLLELAVGMSMVLSDIVIILYYKVSEWSKSVGICILIVELVNFVPNFDTNEVVSIFHSIYTSSR